MFNSQTYHHRRQALLRQAPTAGLILIFGNEESPMNYPDNVYSFRQDSNFLYFTGIMEAHHFLIIDPATGEATLFGDDLSLDHVVWMGAQPTLAEKAAAAGLEKWDTYAAGLAKIKQAATSKHAVHYLPPYRHDRLILLANCLEQPTATVEKNYSEQLCRAVIGLRSYKSAEELQEMEIAVNITRAMHLAAMKSCRAGQTEAAVAGIVEGIAVAGGGRLSYPCIGTINGHILHNHYHGNTIRDGQLYLLDAGASSPSQYAGDITRTFPVGQKFTNQQKEIYEVVLEAQEKTIAAVQPGRPFLDIHLLAAHAITQGLKDLGLMKGDVAEAVQHGAHALFFPHGLGHMIGLDVHDMEDLNEHWIGYDDTVQRATQFGLKSLRLAKKLEPGFVLTIEPGIYFIPALIDQWASSHQHQDFINYPALEAYRQFGGIRIEDNLVVTPTAYEILGNPIPKTVMDIEALRQQQQH